MPNTISRILVVDDNPAIHQDFNKIFSDGSTPSEALDEAEAALFGADEPAAAREIPRFQIDSALQGHEGIALVREARRCNAPYAVAFIDMRMPPGMDGIETTAAIWEEDPDIQIVICTAYSDYTWGEMLAKLGRSDRLVILKKPFDNIEVLQIANALSVKWRAAVQGRARLGSFSASIAECVQRLGRVQDLLHELTAQANTVAQAACAQSAPHAQSICDQALLIQREIALLIEQHRNELAALQRVQP